jgi:hypothetical protein
VKKQKSFKMNAVVSSSKKLPANAIGGAGIAGMLTLVNVPFGVLIIVNQKNKAVNGQKT